MSDQDFVQAMEQTVEVYERTNGHAAGRTRKMIERYGPIEALSRLMVSAELQQGFKVLRDTNQLDKSFEALVTRHQNLFKEEVIKAAQWRLDHPNDLF